MFQVTVNDTPYNSKPPHKDVGFIKSRLQVAQFPTVLDFVEHIETGRSFHLAVHTDNQADNQHWQSQQVFAIDFDNKPSDLKKAGLAYPVNTQEILLKCQKLGLTPNIVYHTFSHSEALEKFRVVFILDAPLTSYDTAKFISKQLVKTFPGCDSGSTVDTSRLYFGTNCNAVRYSEDLNSLELFISILTSQVIAADGGKKRYIPKDIPELNFDRTVIEHFNYEEAASKIRIFKEFLEGEWLYYPQLFGVLTNLACIKGGLTLATKVMSRQPNYDANALALIGNMRKYNYHPARLENFSHYESDWEYGTIVNYNSKKQIKLIDRQESPKMPLAEAEAKMNEFFNTFKKARLNQIEDPKNYKGENLYIMVVPTGLGKSTQLREQFAGTKCTIAFPYHSLVTEFRHALPPSVINDCSVTPPLPEFSAALATHIERLFSLKLKPEVHAALTAITQGKQPQNYSGIITKTDKALAAKYHDELMRAYRTDNTTVLTTHNRAVYTLFNHSDTLIFDEDPVDYLCKMGEYNGNDLLLLSQNEHGDFGRESEALFYKFRASIGVEKTPTLTYLTKENLLQWYGDSGCTKGAAIIDFVNSTAYTVDKDITDELAVRFVTSNPLPHNKKVLICSATVNIDLYKLLYPRATVLDITDVEMAGNQVQYLYVNSSASAINNNLEEYKQLIGDSPVITYKKYINQFPNAITDVYAHKSEGTDKYKGSECVVLCTPRKKTWFYLLKAYAFGLQDIKWHEVHSQSEQVVRWNGVEFKMITFAYEGLQTVQLADIEAELLQLTGRMRALREPKAFVHLCSSIPVRNFVYDTTKRKKLPAFQLEVIEPDYTKDISDLPELNASVLEIQSSLNKSMMEDMVW